MYIIWALELYGLGSESYLFYSYQVFDLQKEGERGRKKSLQPWNEISELHTDCTATARCLWPGKCQVLITSGLKWKLNQSQWKVVSVLIGLCWWRLLKIGSHTEDLPANRVPSRMTDSWQAGCAHLPMWARGVLRSEEPEGVSGTGLRLDLCSLPLQPASPTQCHLVPAHTFLLG